MTKVKIRTIHHPPIRLTSSFFGFLDPGFTYAYNLQASDFLLRTLLGYAEEKLIRQLVDKTIFPVKTFEVM